LLNLLKKEIEGIKKIFKKDFGKNLGAEQIQFLRKKIEEGE